MNLEEVQNYFKEQISLGNYQIIDRYIATYGGNKLWITLLIENRPFMIEITPYGKVSQLGDIEHNYIQLGLFSNKQQQRIYERFRNEV